MDEQTRSEVESSGNPTDANSEAPNNDSGQKPEQSFIGGDPRFKDPETLYKSYKELESTLGDMKPLKEKAKLADSAILALAAERGVSEEEARRLLEKSSSELLEKNASKLQDVRVLSEVRELKLQNDKRDLLEAYPESREVLPQVLDLARSTGQTPEAVYKRHFKSLVEKASGPMAPSSGSLRPSYRGESAIAAGDSNSKRDYESRLDAARKSTRRPEIEANLLEALKAKNQRSR